MNHIKSIQDDKLSWCGEPITLDFHFKTIDQAILTKLYYLNENPMPCTKCVDDIIRTLLTNTAI